MTIKIQSGKPPVNLRQRAGKIKELHDAINKLKVGQWIVHNGFKTPVTAYNVATNASLRTGFDIRACKIEDGKYCFIREA